MSSAELSLSPCFLFKWHYSPFFVFFIPKIKKRCHLVFTEGLSTKWSASHRWLLPAMLRALDSSLFYLQTHRAPFDCCCCGPATGLVYSRLECTVLPSEGKRLSVYILSVRPRAPLQWPLHDRPLENHIHTPGLPICQVAFLRVLELKHSVSVSSPSHGSANPKVDLRTCKMAQWVKGLAANATHLSLTGKREHKSWKLHSDFHVLCLNCAHTLT